MDLDQLAELRRVDELHVGRQSKDVAHHRRHEQFIGGQVPDPMAFLRARSRDDVALFGLAQPVFGAPLRIDVADRARDTHRLPIGVAHTQAASAHPVPAAVVALHAILDFIRRRAAGKVRVHRLDASGAIVRMKSY